jgi:hypothetical protein
MFSSRGIRISGKFRSFGAKYSEGSVNLRVPFETFWDSTYYSKSEICGGAMTVSFEVPLFASDALTTLHPLLENVLQTVCRKLQKDSGAGGFDLSRSFLHL